MAQAILNLQLPLKNILSAIEEFFYKIELSTIILINIFLLWFQFDLFYFTFYIQSPNEIYKQGSWI